MALLLNILLVLVISIVVIGIIVAVVFYIKMQKAKKVIKDEIIKNFGDKSDLINKLF